MKTDRNPISHRKWEKMDGLMKGALHSISEGIEASDDMKRRIDLRIDEASKEVQMKHISMKKVMIGAAAACLLLGTVALAGSGIRQYTASSMPGAAYTSFEDVEKAEAQAGYSVDAVEVLGEGFTFQYVNIMDEAVLNEAGEMEDNGLGLHMGYACGSEEISLFARQLYEGEDREQLMDKNFSKTRQVGDVVAGFLQNINKFVPPDYELTEEDKKNMKDPLFNLAYGSSQVEVSTGSHVMWVKDGVFYSLYGSDLTLGADEMLDMAENMIQNGK